MNPLVSIIIPTFNRYDYIGETLESVIMQTYRNWECIIVDDGSSDYTSQLIDFYCEKDNRFKYFTRTKDLTKGANSCRNLGFKKSSGKYIQWLEL